ncbi:MULTISPECIES: GUN4 domain-containing protein [Moorena]|nr:MULTISPECIES: GUN4 domain-containing protein [Moorena]
MVDGCTPHLTEKPKLDLYYIFADQLPSSWRKPMTRHHYEPELKLHSEKGLDYTKLRDVLAAGKWKEADLETARVLLEAAGREAEKWLDVESLKTFPCADLLTIDQLWVRYSQGHFGLSVQQSIYQEAGGDCVRLGERIGWRVRGEWIAYSKIKWNLDAQMGHLPVCMAFIWSNHRSVSGIVWLSRVGCEAWYTSLMQRLLECSI